MDGWRCNGRVFDRDEVAIIISNRACQFKQRLGFGYRREWL